MGHNSIVSGHPKSTGIPRVDGVVNETLGFRASQTQLKQEEIYGISVHNPDTYSFQYKGDVPNQPISISKPYKPPHV